MKLINYEEYKNKLLKVRDSIPLTVPAASYELMLEKPYTHGMSMRGGIRKALRCLEECQNVSNVAPVAYGEWVYPHWGYRGNFCYDCSVCGNEAMHKEYKWKDKKIYPICPWCGARMGGGENDG